MADARRAIRHRISEMAEPLSRSARALSHVFSDAPIERLEPVRQIEDETEATRFLYTLLHDYLSANARLDDTELRTLLADTPMGDTTMQTLASIVVPATLRVGRASARQRRRGLLRGRCRAEARPTRKVAGTTVEAAPSKPSYPQGWATAAAAHRQRPARREIRACRR